MVELDELAGMVVVAEEERLREAGALDRCEQEVILSFGNRRRAWKLHDDAEVRCKAARDAWKARGKEVMVKADAFLKEDAELLRRACARASELQDLMGDGMRKFLWRTYRVVFRNMCSRSVELGLVRLGRNEKVKLCVGPYGFGVRWNVQAKEITELEYVKDLFEQKDEVCRLLRGRQRMGVWAKKFEDFCAIVPSIDAAIGSSVSVVLDVPIVPLLHSSKEDEPVSLKEVSFSSQGVSWDEYGRYGRSERRVSLGGVGDESQALVYVQLHRQLSSVVERYMVETESMVVAAKVLRAKLEECFGRQLLASEL